MTGILFNYYNVKPSLLAGDNTTADDNLVKFTAPIALLLEDTVPSVTHGLILTPPVAKRTRRGDSKKIIFDFVVKAASTNSIQEATTLRTCFLT